MDAIVTGFVNQADGATAPMEFSALDAAARRLETPCGDGVMVWRIWGEGAPLVLTHGAQGAWSHWIRNIPALARRRMVIAPDLPGCGESAMPDPVDQTGIADALAAGLRLACGDAVPVDVVGFSFGGAMAGWLAALYPELVRRLVLVGCGGLGTPHGHVHLQRAKGLAGAERAAVLRSNLLGLMLHHPETVDEVALYQLERNGRAGRINPAPLVLPDRLLAVLPHVEAPVDAIWGEFDRPHPDPAAQEAVLRAVQPDMRFAVIPDAGHWAMFERPGAFDAALGDILEAPLRPRRAPPALDRDRLP